MSKQVVIAANVKFPGTCKYCNSPFDYYEDWEYDYEGDPRNRPAGHYKCGTSLEHLVQVRDHRTNSYGPSRSWDERLIERTWACEQLAVRK